MLDSRAVRIAVVPGDGIGVDVTREALKVLETISRRRSLPLETVSFPWSADHYLKTGETLPPGAFEDLSANYDAILMANHGVVTYGTDLQSAYMKMETVEHFAQIALVTHVLGQQKPLACEDLEKLVAARSRYLGVNSAARMPVNLSPSLDEELVAALRSVQE